MSGGSVFNFLAAAAIVFSLFLGYLYGWICNGEAMLGGPCVIIFHAHSLSYIPDQELQEEPTLKIIGLPLIFFLMFLLKESIVSMSRSVVHKELACQNNLKNNKRALI